MNETCSTSAQLAVWSVKALIVLSIGIWIVPLYRVATNALPIHALAAFAGLSAIVLGVLGVLLIRLDG